MAPHPPRSTWRQRVLQWALRRQGPDRLPLTLHSRRVYIVPTRAGWIFAVLIAVMFIAGMNYGNGLALLLTFWLAGFAIVAMVQTQRCLSGAVLQEASASPGFAGGMVSLRLQLQARNPPEDFSLRADDLPPVASDGGEAAQALRIDLPAPVRGRWQAPPLRLQTSAPFGLFRTWTWVNPPVGTLVYPAPAGRLPVPQSPGDGDGAAQLAAGHEEFAWLRDFRDGDSPRQVAWKAFARGGPLRVREYRSPEDARQVFDFDALAPLPLEVRLSQLCRWIIEADARGEDWELRLPGHAPLSGTGAHHREQCLALLALHALPQSAT